MFIKLAEFLFTDSYLAVLANENFYQENLSILIGKSKMNEKSNRKMEKVKKDLVDCYRKKSLICRLLFGIINLMKS